MLKKIQGVVYNKSYPWIRLPMTTFCRGPWGIAGWAPNMHPRCVAACCSPHRIGRTRWESVVRMIWRIRHDRFMWIVTPLYLISMLRPLPFIFLGQNMSPMHSIFLLGNRQCYLINNYSMNLCELGLILNCTR